MIHCNLWVLLKMTDGLDGKSKKPKSTNPIQEWKLRLPKNRNCIQCGKTFYANPAMVKRGHGLFCSRSCMGIYKSGDKASHWRGGRQLINGYVQVWTGRR